MRLLGRRTGRSSGLQEGIDWASLHRLDDAARLEEYRRHCSWPSLYYDTTAWILKIAGAESFVEVGVAYGYHAKHLITELPQMTYVGVDPYRPSYDPSDRFPDDVAQLFACEPLEAMDRLHRTVADTIDTLSDGRSRLIRETSVAAATQFTDASLDAVFIDGNHQTDAVLEDIAAWFPKIRPGGILIGDDYQWPTVSAAWDEAFSGSTRREMQFIENEGSGYRTVVARKP